MIGPQAVVKHNCAKEPFDIQEVYQNANKKGKGKKAKSMINLLQRTKKRDGKEPEIIKFGVENVEWRCIWDIGETLSDENVGYRENYDYFVKEIYIARESVFSIKAKMWKMLKQCQDKLERQNEERNNRYVFIIDRRDRDNINKKNMEYNKPNINNEYRKRSPAKDMIYLIIHKEYNKLPKELYLVQEAGLGLSQNIDDS